MINRTYKFLLKPNDAQKQKIDGIIERCKFVVDTYNSHKYSEDTKFVDIVNDYINTYSNLYREERGIYAKALFQIGKHSSFPSKDAFTFLYSDYINRNFPLEDGEVFISNVGYVKYNNSRKLPDKSTIKYISVKHDIDDRFYAFFVLEIEEEDIQNLDINSIIGLDYSSTNFFVDSNGNSPVFTRRYREYEEKIKDLQAKLVNKETDSNNYKDIQNKIKVINHKIYNKRDDDLKKLASALSNKYDYIVMEDLDMVGIAQSYNLAKNTYDNSYHKFASLLESKMEEKGKKLIKVDRWFKSSQTCNVCGYVNSNLDIDEKTWVCPSCNFILNRDVNAAVNIKNEGIKMINNVTG